MRATGVDAQVFVSKSVNLVSRFGLAGVKVAGDGAVGATPVTVSVREVVEAVKKVEAVEVVEVVEAAKLVSKLH